MYSSVTHNCLANESTVLVDSWMWNRVLLLLKYLITYVWNEAELENFVELFSNSLIFLPAENMQLLVSYNHGHNNSVS